MVLSGGSGSCDRSNPMGRLLKPLKGANTRNKLILGKRNAFLNDQSLHGFIYSPQFFLETTGSLVFITTL